MRARENSVHCSTSVVVVNIELGDTEGELSVEGCFRVRQLGDVECVYNGIYLYLGVRCNMWQVSQRPVNSRYLCINVGLVIYRIESSIYKFLCVVIIFDGRLCGEFGIGLRFSVSINNSARTSATASARG